MHDVLFAFEFVDVHVKMNVSPFNGITFVYILLNKRPSLWMSILID